MSKMVTCVDVFGKSYKVAVDKLIWRPSTYGIVIKDDKILLSRQFGDKFDLPGGGLDLGELPKEGVVREVAEETGIRVKNPKLLGVENSFFQSSHAEDKAYHSLLFYFVCEHVGGEISKAGFDGYERQYAQMAEWVALSKLDKLDIASTVNYKPYVKKALALS
jgi:8-oxo-dGTP diphosphatase